jgi:hypothetical protein
MIRFTWFTTKQDTLFARNEGMVCFASCYIFFIVFAFLGFLESLEVEFFCHCFVLGMGMGMLNWMERTKETGG